MNKAQDYRLSMLIRLLAIGISSIGMLVLLPYVLSKLGEYNFGIWGMVSSITSYLLLLDFGIALACTRYLSIRDQSKENWTSIISNSLFLSLIIAGLLLLIAIALAYANHLAVFDNEQLLISRVICIVILEVALSIPLRMYLSLLRTEVRYIDIGLFEVIRVTCRIIGIGLALHFGANLLQIVILAAVVNVMFFILPLLSSYMRHQTLFFSYATINRKTLSELLHFSKFAAISQSAEFLKFRTDSVLVSILIGITASAHYTIIVFIIMMVTQILMRFMSYWDTIVIRHIGEKKLEAAERTVFKSLEIGIGLSIFSCLNLYIYGGLFIELWVGEQYIFLHNPLLLLALVLFGITFQLATTPYFNGLKKEKTNASIDFAEVILKCLLLFPLTSFLGFEGFIVTTIFTASVCSIGMRIILFSRYSSRKLSSILFQLIKITYKPLLLSLFILLSYQAIQLHGGLSPISSLIYIGITQVFTLTAIGFLAFKFKSLNRVNFQTQY